MNSTISAQRNAIRKQVRTSRRSLTNSEQQHASILLLKKLIAHPKVQQASHVSLTLAHDGEIDLTPFIDWCWQHNKKVALPVVHPNQTGKLLFLYYHNNTEMIINRYGIKEPKLTIDNKKTNSFLNTVPVEQLDIIFTPLVAFDIQGNRIGMGGGYYDRLLVPWFNQKQGPYPIGLAHDCQKIDDVPIQSWDIPLPEIITPQAHFYFEK